MSSSYLVALQAQIAASLARIEGMKAANHARQEDGYALAYDSQAFFDEAAHLEGLSRQAHELERVGG